MVRSSVLVRTEIKEETQLHAQSYTKRRSPWLRIGVLLLLACFGTSWFMYQLVLVPQLSTFAPRWQGAQWVQAADGNNPVAYFRYTTSFSALPDAAYVTVAASQSFRLYVNGVFIGSNMLDIVQGTGPRAYIYDVLTALQPGVNVIGVRVANIDQHAPLLRATFGTVQGSTVVYHGTGSDWVATAQSSLVYPRYATRLNPWTTTDFQENNWLPARTTTTSLDPSLVSANPLLYEHVLPNQWMSAGIGQDAYFVRSLTISADYASSWMRIVAAGPADIFINGQHIITWNGQVPIRQQQVINYLSDQETVVQYRQGLVIGVYDISPYLHAGANTIAVHVSAPGNSTAQVGLEGFTSALSLDMLLSDSHNHTTWISPDNSWHASMHAAPGWEQGNQVSLSWAAPAFIGRPGVSRMAYLSDNQSPRNVSIPPLAALLRLILLCTVGVLATWLMMAFLLKWRYYRTRTEALAIASLAYLPVLACEGLLIIIAREPQVLPPFPYTWPWGCLLLGVMLAGFLLVWLHAHFISRASLSPIGPNLSWARRFIVQKATLRVIQRLGTYFPLNNRLLKRLNIAAWLKVHWGLLVIVAIACVLSCYGLSYEPYWQDELTSYYAAKGVMAHGVPTLLSGFIYTKGELYSYMLALFMFVFGDQHGAPRLLSAIEYLCGLVVLYEVARRLFHRHIALLATALLAFAPSSLLWGREVRMYEQAQLLYIIVFYLFYRALQRPQEPKRIYLAVAATVAMYLSHEESFILFPTLLLYAFVGSWDRRTSRPVVLFMKHWWIAAGAGAGLILLQSLLSKVTHPPLLGTDQTQQPFIQFTVENVPYYFKLLFWQGALQSPQPYIVLNTLLAIVGGVIAIRQKDRAALYCSLMFWGPLLVLVFLFTMTSDRYIYPVLPSLYLMTAYALQKMWSMLRGMRQISTSQTPTRGVSTPSRGGRYTPDPHKGSLYTRQGKECRDLPCGGLSTSGRGGSVETSTREVFPASNRPTYDEGYTAGRKLSLPMRVLLIGVMVLVCAGVFILPVMPLSNYNLLVSRQLGLLYHRHYPDYDATANYLRQHMRPGDVVVAVSPAISVVYYVHQVDYFFSIDRALYLFEENGRITDTPTGTTPLLSQNDFLAVLNMHNRVWIVSDNGIYQAGIMKWGRFSFPSDFHIVYEGYGSAVYLRGGDNIRA